MTRVLVVVGNPRSGSRTRVVADAVAARLTKELELAQHLTVEVADLSHGLFHSASTELDECLRQLAQAQVVVVASPTYKATYTGLLKALCDRLPGHALQGALAVPVMVAGDPRHGLAVEVHLAPLLRELGADLTPSLFVLESDIADLEVLVDQWWSRSGPAITARCAMEFQPLEQRDQ